MKSALIAITLLLPVLAHAGSLTLHTPQMLTWDHPGADSYRVYVNEQMVREVRECQTELKGLPPGKAWVIAVDGGIKSEPSNVIEIPAQKPRGTVTLRRPKPTVAVKPVATIGEVKP